MAGTFSQIYVHIVFAVKGRQRFIPKSKKEDLHKFINAVLEERGQKMLAIHCMPDHIHLFIGLKPSVAVSDIVREVKAVSSKFINDQKWLPTTFEWQKGYGAFSYSQSQIPVVINYIKNQEQHHKVRSFKDEYLDVLRKFQVSFNEKYLFDFD